MHGEGVRGGGGGERELHLGEAADPLPHLLPGRHGLAGPVEGARDEVSDLVLPLLSLPVATQGVISASSSSVTTINLRQT